MFKNIHQDCKYVRVRLRKFFFKRDFAQACAACAYTGIPELINNSAEESLMNKVIEEISKLGIVPVVVLNDAKDALPLAEALIKGGLPCAEVTFRTSAAEESIRLIAEKYPQMLIGAGTVLTTEQADKAAAAGAKFIVSPGLNPVVVSHCLKKGVPIVPGCANPSDIEAALTLGLDTVKFFPAEAAGGIKMIKAMSAPYGNMRFMPTGGINENNLNDYLSFKKVIACGGSWMVAGDIIAEGNFEKVTELTRQAVKKMLGIEFAHIGINSDSAENAEGIADGFCALFGFGKKVGNSSVFAGNAVEVMKSTGYGEKGHIAFSTGCIDRAVYHLEKQGFEFDADSAKYAANGNLAAIYLKGEIGGFAVHLVQK